MIVRSSNLATNILLEKICTKSVHDFIQALGISGVSVLRGINDDAARGLGLNNRVTAHGLTQTMKLIAEGKIVSKQASGKMARIMLGQEFNESIPALLPETVRVAHKTGWDGNVHHDTGIDYLEHRKPYALSIMTRGFAEAGEAHTCMRTISKLIYDTFQ
jgi:beta-lactamase class A